MAIDRAELAGLNPGPTPRDALAPTPANITKELLRLSWEMDQATVDLVNKSREWAYAENEYRKAKANAFLGSSGTVQARQAHVDKATDKERYDAHLAEALKGAALENVRNKRAQLSALQTAANAFIEDAKMGARYGP